VKKVGALLGNAAKGKEGKRRGQQPWSREGPHVEIQVIFKSAREKKTIIGRVCFHMIGMRIAGGRS